MAQSQTPLQKPFLTKKLRMFVMICARIVAIKVGLGAAEAGIAARFKETAISAAVINFFMSVCPSC